MLIYFAEAQSLSIMNTYNIYMQKKKKKKQNHHMANMETAV